MKDRDEIARTLVGGEARRFGCLPSTLDRYAGQVFPVLRRVGPYYDPRTQRVLRPQHAVVLQGAVCDGSAAAHVDGCDRGCELFWSEAWLERVEDEENPSVPAQATGSSADSSNVSAQALVRVRSLAAIEAVEQASPDPSGVRFTAATMASFCGRTFRVRGPAGRAYDVRRDRVIPLLDVVLLEDVHCPGAPMLAAGRCDRRCALLWRAAWLEPVES